MTADAAVTRWVGFELGGQRFALEIARVREVIPAAHCEPVPGAPALAPAVTHLRGRILSVVDLHRRLQIATPPQLQSDGRACLIVVEADGEWMALRVDRIGELYSLPAEAIKPAPSHALSGGDAVVRGFVSRIEGVLSLLDLPVLMEGVAL